MKTKEQLLIPRYRVKVGYPMSPYRIGFIITFTSDIARIVETGQCVVSVNEDEFKKYPHLFEPLAWWEYRELEDIPSYLSLEVSGRTVYSKVLAIRQQDRFFRVICDDDPGKEFTISMYEPATTEEYEAYKKANP